MVSKSFMTGGEGARPLTVKSRSGAEELTLAAIAMILGLNMVDLVTDAPPAGCPKAAVLPRMARQKRPV